MDNAKPKLFDHCFQWIVVPFIIWRGLKPENKDLKICDPLMSSSKLFYKMSMSAVTCWDDHVSRARSGHLPSTADF